MWQVKAVARTNLFNSNIQSVIVIDKEHTFKSQLSVELIGVDTSNWISQFHGYSVMLPIVGAK